MKETFTRTKVKREDINKNVLCLNGYINVSSFEINIEFGVIMNEKI